MLFKQLNTLLLILFLNSCLLGQKKLLREIERFSTRTIHPDSVLAILQKENDLVIGFATYNPAWGKPPYYLLVAKNKKQWTAYEYRIKEYARVLTDSNGKQFTEPLMTVNAFEIKPDLTDSLYTIFKQQKIWELKCDAIKDFLFAYCVHLKNIKFDPCSISDASSVGSLIMTKEYINASSFYAPEYYEYECCPGNKDRQKFLNTIAPIKALFKKMNITR